jgi:hypothetical protein
MDTALNMRIKGNYYFIMEEICDKPLSVPCSWKNKTHPYFGLQPSALDGSNGPVLNDSL